MGKLKIDPSQLDLFLTILYKLVSPLPPLPVQTVDSIVFLKPEDIAYITSAGNSVEIVDTAGAKWKRFDTVSALEKRLKPDPYFFKANRSVIVNLRQVRTLKNSPTGVHEVTFATLPAEHKAAIADSVFAAFKSAMGLIIPEPRQK